MYPQHGKIVLGFLFISPGNHMDVEERRKVCVDTSYLLSVGPLPPEFEMVLPPSVEAEAEKYGALPPMYTVMMPSAPAVKRVMEVAGRTGDTANLSEADVEVIALALELGCPVATDDYDIQNTAAVLGVDVIKGVQRGIAHIIKWRFRCTGCGRYYRRKYEECPACGSPLKPVPSSTQRLSSSRE